MAQDAGECLGIHTAGQGMGGERVTEIVKADAGQSGLFQQRFQVTVYGVGIGGLLRPERVGEDPLGIGLFLALGQKLGRAGRQGDGPLSRTRLGFTSNQNAAILNMERPADKRVP